MFIKETKTGRGQKYYHIVESYRRDGKSRHRTLMSLGRVKDTRLEELLHLIGRHLDVVSASQIAKEIDVQNTFILGPLLIIDTLFKQLGLYELLKDIQKRHPKVAFDLMKVVFTLVVNRFIEPCSKLKLYSHWQQLFYPDFLEKKFKIRRFILVGDRGLFSNKNLQSVKAKGDEFIVGLKLGLLKDRHEEIYNIKNFKFINEDIAIYETSYNNDRCIITWSRKRAERDKKVREDILSKIEAQLSKKSISTRSFLSNSNYKKYITHPKSKGKPTLNKSAINESEKTDGFFGIITNTDNLSSEEIIMNYKQLWKVENSFRELKGTLKTRPMFHWTDKRILGHLVVCFLSYLCEAYFAKKLDQRKITLKNNATTEQRIKSRPLSVAEAMSKLKEVRAIPVRYKDKTIWIRTDIYGNNADVFKAIGAKIPSKQLKIEST